MLLWFLEGTKLEMKEKREGLHRRKKMRLRSRSGWGFQMGNSALPYECAYKRHNPLYRVIIDVMTQLKCFIAGTG